LDCEWIAKLQPGYADIYVYYFAIVIVVTACGSERLGSHFEVIKRAGHIENILRGGEQELGLNKDFDNKIEEGGQPTVENVEG